MQPFWALSFPSLDALEECEQRRNGLGKTHGRGDKVVSNPSGADAPKNRKSSKKLAQVVAEIPAMPYTELIAEHFARAVYIA